MADITRWDPFAEMATLRSAVDRMFDDVRPGRLFGATNGSEGYFPIDLLETNEDVIVKASLPGVAPEDIEISVTGQVLTLKAEVKEEHESQAHNVYRRERRAGTFVRQLTLPAEVQPDRAGAVCENGVLRLSLPKAETAKPRTIKVQAKDLIGAGT